MSQSFTISNEKIDEVNSDIFKAIKRKNKQNYGDFILLLFVAVCILFFVFIGIRSIIYPEGPKEKYNNGSSEK